MELDPMQYVYVQVADAVAADIASGRLPGGARLPNERAMGEQYGIAPGTARRVVRELRDRGLVTTLPHKGTFVLGVGTDESTDEHADDDAASDT